jgi:hypothetical protein
MSARLRNVVRNNILQLFARIGGNVLIERRFNSVIFEANDVAGKLSIAFFSGQRLWHRVNGKVRSEGNFSKNKAATENLFLGASLCLAATTRLKAFTLGFAYGHQ